MKCLPLAACLLVSILTMGSDVWSADPSESTKSEESADNANSSKTPDDDLSVTEHVATIGGKKIAYTATAGTVVLKSDDAESKARASIFFVAYTANDDKGLASRPVTYCFNGGPGSSAVWLQLGMLAPVRVPIRDDASFAPPPRRLIPNPYSLLDKTDLVFIDPVSTGFSRPAAGQKKKQFHGYDEDIRSVAQFIHLYTTRYERWQSPRFLMGESYGTLRAAGLTGHLLDRYKMDLSGIALISSVLDFQTIRFGTDNDLPYVLFLPTYTATAWYHQRLPADLQQDLKKTLKEVESFALNEYATALVQGDRMSDVERQLIIARLARYTGLAPDVIDRADLRIPSFQFAKQLLWEKRKLVGRFDSRFVGDDLNASSTTTSYDPSASALFGAFTETMNHYLRSDLQVKRDVPYEILTDNVHPWNYGRFENRYVSATRTLKTAMVKNPYLKVFVANGRYDLATPYLATEYTFDHLGLPAALRKNITMTYYEAGHMMYVHEPSLKQLKKDLSRFYDAALPE